jgi:hypothetical protein
MPTARLALIADRSTCPRGHVPDLGIFGGMLHRDIFNLSWGPAIQAVTAVLEAAPSDDVHTVTDGMRAFTTVRSLFLEQSDVLGWIHQDEGLYTWWLVFEEVKQPRLCWSRPPLTTCAPLKRACNLSPFLLFLLPCHFVGMSSAQTLGLVVPGQRGGWASSRAGGHCRSCYRHAHGFRRDAL